MDYGTFGVIITWLHKLCKLAKEIKNNYILLHYEYMNFVNYWKKCCHYRILSKTRIMSEYIVACCFGNNYLLMFVFYNLHINQHNFYNEIPIISFVFECTKSYDEWLFRIVVRIISHGTTSCQNEALFSNIDKVTLNLVKIKTHC